MNYKLYSRDLMIPMANSTFTWLFQEEKYFNTLLSEEQREFWRHNWFTYTLNNYGFRCNDFSTYNKPTIAVLGSSHTFGTGLPLEKTWAWIVAENLGLELVNLAVPAGGMDTCSRVAKFWLPCIHPEIVLVQIPPLFRREYYVEDKGFSTKGVWDDTFTKFALDNWTDEEDKLNCDKNLDLINYYSDCKVTSFNLDDIAIGKAIEPIARDGRHWGIERHKLIAENVLNILK